MSKEQALSLNRELAGLDAQAILERASKVFDGRIVFASALGAEDQVITDMIFRNGLKIEIITLDTGRWFNETYDLLAATEHRYGIKLTVYFPERDAVETMVREKGINLFFDGIAERKHCCAVRKLEPLRRALSGRSAWICGLRREQSITRGGIEAVEYDEVNQMLKFNPLADWSESQVWDYIKSNDVPYNELHDRGMPSIGCACCTRAVKRTEDLRSGRWWWETPEQKECGLHLSEGKLVRSKKQ